MARIWLMSKIVMEACIIACWGQPDDSTWTLVLAGLACSTIHSYLRTPRRFLRGTSSQHRSVAFQAAMPPFVGTFFLRAAALFRPGDRPHHRSLRAVPFAACRYTGQFAKLRATQRVPVYRRKWLVANPMPLVFPFE